MTVSKKVRIGSDIVVGSGEPLLLIAGPCQIESYDHCCLIGESVLAATRDVNVSFVFKSSFDKANRTSVNSQRGPGLEDGIRILERVRETLGVPVLTDIHTAEQATNAGAVVDVLQIPAFLCRQTDLLLAAGATGKAINVKKGQFLHPSDMQFCAEKIAATKNENVMLCERGTCFGYRDLVVDMRSFLLMAETGYPVIFDATHSVQSMGGAGGSSGGSREYIPHLARAAVATGVHGVFLECHQEPDSAPSDAASMLPLESVPTLIQQLAQLHSLIHQPN
jgi:2-dehydro-3-deoxyphosphooctonate aldolase (KDO 8-P synthase)